MDVIDFYINDILKKQLDSFGLISNDIILDSVKARMLSLLKHWNEKEFLNAILVTGMEEATFYLPNANINLKAFVVLSVRNSLIESAGSSFYKNYNFEIQIEDEQMCEITKKAIIYFKKYSLEDLSKKIDCSNDYYLDVANKYPEAFETLKKLGSLKGKELYFEPLHVEHSVTLDFFDSKNIKLNSSVIEDGMTLKFNQQLNYALNQAKDMKELGFFTDCFKFLSRNYEKILRVLQYLIENNTYFCTFDYYISNGYIAKRSNLLKASHNTEDMIIKFKKNNEVTSKHKRSLELWKEVYSSFEK